MPIEKLLALPEGQLLVAITLLFLFILGGNGVMGSYYRRSGRPRWRLLDGMSNFPLFHFNAREWILLVTVGAAFVALTGLVGVFGGRQ